MWLFREILKFTIEESLSAKILRTRSLKEVVLGSRQNVSIILLFNYTQMKTAIQTKTSSRFYSSTIYINQKAETSQRSVKRLMDKQMLYIHTIEYFSAIEGRKY